MALALLESRVREEKDEPRGLGRSARERGLRAQKGKKITRGVTDLRFWHGGLCVELSDPCKHAKTSKQKKVDYKYK